MDTVKMYGTNNDCPNLFILFRILIHYIICLIIFVLKLHTGEMIC